jgi:serine/threonine-protein kinase
MNQVGDIINSRWRLVEELSSNSGQGNTFLVVDALTPDDATQYVIKLLKVLDPRTLARFEREIRACLALQHPNIVKIIDSKYEDTATPYLVTEHCSGGELKEDKIKDLSILKRLRMFESICEAIAFAHSNDVVHRDIKAQNIFLETDTAANPVVGDLGLCFFGDDANDLRLTLTSEAVGAWQTRPPEADIGRVESGSDRGDVYMLGKLLYWFLSGGRYPNRENFDREPYELRKRDSPHAVYLAYEILGKSVRERPEDRYFSAGRMLQDVKELVSFTANDGRYLDCTILQSCVFCRVGNYDWEFLGTEANDKYQFAEYGLSFHQPPSVVYPRVLFGRCRRCGNVQQFRLDDRLTRWTEWSNVPRSPHAR